MLQFSKSLLQAGEIESKEMDHIERALVKSRKRLLFHPPQIQLKSAIQVLGDCTAFTSLSQETLAILHQRSKEKIMNKGHVLYSTGDKSNGVRTI